MNFNDWVWAVVWLLATAPILIAVAYLIVRAASLAHFRTKLEYLRSMLKELGKGEHNGQT